MMQMSFGPRFGAGARRQSVVLLPWMLLLLAGVVWPGRVDGNPPAPADVSLTVPLTAEAASKIDPMIRLAMALPDKSLRNLAPLGMSIELFGESPDALRYPVLVRTSLDDVELAAMGAPVDSRAGDIVTTVVDGAALARLASDPRVTLVEAARQIWPVLDVSIPEVRADLVNDVGDPPTGYTGEGVIVGMIDSGIDHTHADFKNSNGTSRILSIWDQGCWNDQTPPSPPSGYNYGCEYTKTLIEGGQANDHVDPVAHGTHVMGIAAGDGSSLTGAKYRGVAWESDILVVRNDAVCDLFCYGGGVPPWEYGGLYGQPSGTKGSIDGLSWMLAKASALGKKLVVNQSQGTFKGPHDGSTLLEAAYNNLVAQQGLIVCIAAGNDQDSNWHGRATVGAGGQAQFVIAKQAVDNLQDPGRYYMDFECWYPAGNQFRWTLRSPGGTTLQIPASINPEQYPGQFTARPDTVWYWATTSHSANQQGYANFIVWNWSQLGVESGNWTLTAVSENNSSGQVDLYCERNQYSVAVTTNTSLASMVGMPGTAGGAITVASYNSKLSWLSIDGSTYSATGENPVGDISTFSSWGPRRDGAQKPDLAAPGAWIMSVLAAGSQPPVELTDPGGKHKIISGTSMATPHVTGAIALMLQKQPTLTPAEAKQVLQQTARSDAFTGSVPNDGWGYGKLDVKAAVDALSGGGPGACATELGDANADSQVNVFDLIAVVNDILAITPLSEAGRACADMDESGAINVFDLIGIVNVILNPGSPRPAGEKAAGDSPPLAWGERLGEDAFSFVVDGSRAAAVELALMLPRGYATAGPARLRGGAPGSTVAHQVRPGVVTILAYNQEGNRLGDGTVAVELPLRRAWDGGRTAGDLEVTRVLVADASGGALRLAEDPSLFDPGPEIGPEAVGGVRAWLARTSPNPMAGASRIAYALEVGGVARLTVFDAAGRQVRALWNGWQAAGEHEVVWDGRNDAGIAVGAGSYFVQLQTPGDADSRRILVIR